MRVLLQTAKYLLAPGMVLLATLPLLSEYVSYRKDVRQKISHKRFRLLVFSCMYGIGVTVAVSLLTDTLSVIDRLPWIQTLAQRVSIAARIGYAAQVYAALLINLAIGFGFRFCMRFVRIGLKKKNLLQPGKDGEFTLLQRAERAVIRFFHTETWSLVTDVMKIFNAVVSAIWTILFILYQLPIIIDASWLPYPRLDRMFRTGYLYPVITLLMLWECYFFLAGNRNLEKECPDLLKEETDTGREEESDLERMDEELRSQFGNYYLCDVDLNAAVVSKETASPHNEYTEMITQAVEQDTRIKSARREQYMDCLDTLFASRNSVLFNGNVFSEFSVYFIRYLSLLAARGDNIVFVCNTDEEIVSLYDYLRTGFSRIASLYYCARGNETVGLDDPIWRITAICGDGNCVEEAAVDECGILVTSLRYLCSERFETKHEKFIQLIDTIVFVDTIETINACERQMVILNTRLKQITETNARRLMDGSINRGFAIRYMSRQIRYICFDDSRTPGLDKVLRNILSVSFDTADAMRFNQSAIMRCYSCVGRPDGEGRISSMQYLDTREEIGIVMNMAILCLAGGASDVSIFADKDFPFDNLTETIASNLGRLPFRINGDEIHINRGQFGAGTYSVIFAFDSGDNLPRALRRYASISATQRVLIIVFAKPYLLRDYYVSNIDSLWTNMQLAEIPVVAGSERDVMQKILVKANAGGVTEAEILAYASSVPRWSGFVASKDISGILWEILYEYGVSKEDSEVGEDVYLHRFFEFHSEQNFDRSGNYAPGDRVSLRRKGYLYNKINGVDWIRLRTEDGEQVLTLPRSRLFQNYIAGQNMVFNGNIYHIHRIDPKRGALEAALAFGGRNDEAYEYVQVRRYRADLRTERTRRVVRRHMEFKRSDKKVRVSDVFVTAFRAPLETVTKGYYEISPHAMTFDVRDTVYHSICDPGNDSFARQAYRLYGEMENPLYGIGEGEHSPNGARMVAIRIVGEFGEDPDRILMPAAFLLTHILGAKFPSVSDSIVVCPVFRKDLSGEDAAELKRVLPELELIGQPENEKDGCTFLLIEDCADDLGVLSALLSAGNDMLAALFSPVCDYLKWYLSADVKSDYLWYGLGHQPACFDLEGLLSLATILGDDKHDLHFIDVKSMMTHDACDFCGKQFRKTDELSVLEDGRKICHTCAGHLTGNSKRVLRDHLQRARTYLESTYGIELDPAYRFFFESTAKIAKRVARKDEAEDRNDIPLRSCVEGKNVYIENALPPANLSEILVRELIHTWSMDHLPGISAELLLGLEALVSMQYLHFLGHTALAAARKKGYESSCTKTGNGFREILQGLKQNPQYRNNPFLYLLKRIKGDVSEELEDQVPKLEEDDGILGKGYKPEKNDRAREGELTYFHYSALTDTQRNAYDRFLEAIKQHAETSPAGGLGMDDVRRVLCAVACDRPDLFYYRTFALGGDTVRFVYGATAEETTRLRERMEPVVLKLLEGIDEGMSAYDVALRLYTRVMGMVDYDTVALEREKAAGGPAPDKIDYLRSICGVFLNGKAVCQGYARTMQYLLQRCGIECAECLGTARSSGGWHSWNVVRIDGEYYYLDVTWDDPSNTSQTVRMHENTYKYFCTTTEEILREHDLDPFPTEIPVLTATRANYYVHNDLILEKYDWKRVCEIAERAGKAKASFIAYKCASPRVYRDAVSDLFGPGGKLYELLKYAAKRDKRIDKKACKALSDETMRVITIYFRYKE